MRAALVRASTYGLGLVMLVGLVAVAHLGAQTSAPEIDGGSISAGLGLLSGTVLILRSRRRTK
jgi:hypothetical protein